MRRSAKRLWWVLLAGTLVAPVCAAELSTGDLLGRPLVAVRVRCDAPIDQDGLRRSLPVAPGDAMTAERLAAVRARLGAREIFSEVRLDLEPREEGVDLVLHLKRRRVVNSVAVTGNEHLSSRETLRLIRVRAGDVFDQSVVDGAVQRLRAHYERGGFPAVAIDPEKAERGLGEVDVVFRVREGAPLVITSVEIDGDGAAPRPGLSDAVAGLVGRRLSREAREKGERALQHALRSEDADGRAFWEARVASSHVVDEGDGARLRFTIDAGPAFVVEFQGNRARSREALLGLMNLRDRLIVTAGTWHELAERIAHAYRAAGYYRVQVAVDSEDDTVRRLRFSIDEGRRYRVRHLRFAGNAAVATGRLRGEMQTQPARWFPWPRSGALDDAVLDEDLRRLWWFYRGAGFETAEILDVVREFDEANGAIDLTIVIDEGPQTMVREVRREGGVPLQVGDVTWEVRVGEPLNDTHVAADRAKLLQVMARLGYLEAKVDTEIRRVPDGQARAATVVYRVEAGGQRRVGSVIAQGNMQTRDRVILRELPLRPGDPLDTEAMLKGQTKLYRLGLFRSVSVQALPEEEGLVHDVAARVRERPPGRVDWGAGYNTRDGLGGFAEVGYDNLGGMARRISLRGQITLDPGRFAPDQYLGSAGYREPRFLDTAWRLSASLLGERSTKTVDQFSLERVAFVTGLDRDLSAQVQAGVEAQVERSDVFDVAPDAVLTDQDVGALRTVAVGPFLVHDGRDDPFLPQRGLFESVRVRYALPRLSTVEFVKVSVQHSHYVPLGGGVVFVYAARGGWARAFDGGAQIPIRERFFLGGRSTVRGFAENSIGPTGSNGHPIGGDVALTLNAEVRVPVRYGIGLAVFSDAGGVYLQDRAVSLHDFRRSVGAGLRYATPVGPLSLDYGVKLDGRRSESVGELHFSIASSF